MTVLATKKHNKFSNFYSFLLTKTTIETKNNNKNINQHLNVSHALKTGAFKVFSNLQQKKNMSICFKVFANNKNNNIVVLYFVKIIIII